MSIDTHSEHDAHGAHDEGHHEPPEVVDGRQRMGIWLFIGGDMIGLSALLFTYLYLRGVDTGGHWMSMLGYTGHPYSYYYNILDVKGGSLPNPTMIHVSTLSAGLNWIVTLLTVISGAIIWAAERGLRATKNAKSYSSMAAFATAVTVVAIIFAIIQLRHIPQIFVANNDSQVMAYTSYDSAMMAVAGSAVIHLFILAFLGLGLTIRSARGVINGDKWYQARLVRFFWVWVAISAVIGSAVTTTINTIH
jgi:heme/copper-type cytochrome/quinol oxidase subunit 3